MSYDRKLKNAVSKSIKELLAREKAISRKDDTRRKIIIGAAVLAGLKNRSQEDQEKTLRRIYLYVTNKKDREFLGLPSLPGMRPGAQ